MHFHSKAFAVAFAELLSSLFYLEVSQKFSGNPRQS